MSNPDQRTAVARAIWAVMREHEDRCDMELEDNGRDEPIWQYADAALAALSPYEPCYVCGRPMDGLSEDDCHCFHFKQLRSVAPTEAAAMAATAPDNALGVLIGSFDAAFVEGLHEVLAETKDERLKDLVERRLLAGYEIAVGPSRAQDALPIDEQSAAAALRKVLDVVRRYLPPDGPTAHDAMADITALVDPWPTQAPVAGLPLTGAAPLSDEQIIRTAVAAMPHTNPGVADDLLGGFTMHTEADDIVAIWKAAAGITTPTGAPE